MRDNDMGSLDGQGLIAILDGELDRFGHVFLLVGQLQSFLQRLGVFDLDQVVGVEFRPQTPGFLGDVIDSAVAVVQRSVLPQQFSLVGVVLAEGDSRSDLLRVEEVHEFEDELVAVTVLGLLSCHPDQFFALQFGQLLEELLLGGLEGFGVVKRDGKFVRGGVENGGGGEGGGRDGGDDDELDGVGLEEGDKVETEVVKSQRNEVFHMGEVGERQPWVIVVGLVQRQHKSHVSVIREIVEAEHGSGRGIAGGNGGVGEGIGPLSGIVELFEERNGDLVMFDKRNNLDELIGFIAKFELIKFSAPERLHHSVQQRHVTDIRPFLVQEVQQSVEVRALGVNRSSLQGDNRGLSGHVGGVGWGVGDDCRIRHQKEDGEKEQLRSHNYY